MRRVVTCVAAMLSALALGCSAGGPQIYPVEGTVVFDDGAPAKALKGYAIEFERTEKVDGKLVSAVGTVGPDGTFRMTTLRDGDGAYVGEHRVVIGPPPTSGDGPAPSRIILGKYASFEASGLTATVGPKANRVTLTVERIKKQ